MLEAVIDFVWGGCGVGWGADSHFHVNPPTTVEVTLKLSWGCDNILLSTLPPVIVCVMSDQTVQRPNNKSSLPVMVAICNTLGPF